MAERESKTPKTYLDAPLALGHEWFFRDHFMPDKSRGILPTLFRGRIAFEFLAMNQPAPASTPQPIRVLVVEDNEDDRELLLRQLKKANLQDQVHFISDGKKALVFLSSNPEERASQLMVIFLDLKLPSLNGLDLLRAIKGIPALKKVPVVIMTSSNNPKDLEECRRLQVLHYVEKPVTFASFSKSIADVFHPPKPA